MKQYTIDENSGNQRLDRYLSKLMPLADRNFLQKMLRKKNESSLTAAGPSPKTQSTAATPSKSIFPKKPSRAFRKKRIPRHFDLTPQIKKTI